MKKIVIAGGSGFIGKSFIHFLNKKIDAEIIVLSRRTIQNHHNIHYVKWDGENLNNWANHLEKADLLLNLAGKSVNCRYNKPNKEDIYESRINSTYILGEAIKQCMLPPKVWINMSTATIYRDEHSHYNTEEKGIIGSGFSVDVAKKWEETFFSIPLFATRKIALRTSFVLGKNGEVYKIYRNHVKLFLSGKHGSGRQWVSWIHEEDLNRAIMFLLDHKELEGIFNICSPNVVRDEEMMKVFRESMGYKWGLNLPSWILKIGAYFLRTEVELILKSRWVYPERLLDSGFVFNYKTMESAVRALSKNTNTVDAPLKTGIHIMASK